jgi:hypothetical protein
MGPALTVCVVHLNWRHDIQHDDTPHKGLICSTHHTKTVSSAVILSVIMSSVAFYLLLCRVSFSSVSLC